MRRINNRPWHRTPILQDWHHHRSYSSDSSSTKRRRAPPSRFVATKITPTLFLAGLDPDKTHTHPNHARIRPWTRVVTVRPTPPRARTLEPGYGLFEARNRLSHVSLPLLDPLHVSRGEPDPNVDLAISPSLGVRRLAAGPWYPYEGSGDNRDPATLSSGRTARALVPVRLLRAPWLSYLLVTWLLRTSKVGERPMA